MARKKLTEKERESILAGVKAGDSYRTIAKRVGVAISTISATVQGCADAKETVDAKPGAERLDLHDLIANGVREIVQDPLTYPSQTIKAYDIMVKDRRERELRGGGAVQGLTAAFAMVDAVVRGDVNALTSETAELSAGGAE